MKINKRKNILLTLALFDKIISTFLASKLEKSVIYDFFFSFTLYIQWTIKLFNSSFKMYLPSVTSFLLSITIELSSHLNYVAQGFPLASFLLHSLNH